MGKLSEAEHDPKLVTRKGPRCGVGVALERLDPDDSATLAAWLGDDDRAHAWIWRALRDHGDMSVGANAISRHRNRECGCYC